MTADQGPATAGIVAGMRVVTADGVELGEVKEIEAGRFKLNAPYQPDYWLAATLIAGCDSETVTLTIAREQLAEYRHEEP